MSYTSRRAFLGGVGHGMLALGLGTALAGRSRAGGLAAFGLAAEDVERLSFGDLEPLAALMQETPPDELQPLLVARLRAGTGLGTLVAAGALANARAFGGQNYTGYHCLMAMTPAYEMSKQLEGARQALPVLKVLYRSSACMQATGAAEEDALPPLSNRSAPLDRKKGVRRLRAALAEHDVAGAEEAFAALCAGAPDQAFGSLQEILRENLDVHRVVLAWRAWETMALTGQEHALTLLRQSVRFCVEAEAERVRRGRPEPRLRTLLPELIEQHGLAGAPLGTRRMEGEQLEELSRIVFRSGKEEAAAAVAQALARGSSTEDVGAALSLAANDLLLHDPGRRSGATEEKPLGSVHGASVGVHASDAARAWRNIAAVSGPRDAMADLIAGAYHTAGQSEYVGREPFPYESRRGEVRSREPKALLGQAREAIEAGDQQLASAVVCCYGEYGCSEGPLFELLLDYAVSEDGALHAEKYYRTAREDFTSARSAFRWRHAVALARVTASEHGHVAPGQAAARELLGVG